MPLQTFYEYNRLCKHIYIWLNGACIKLSLKQFEELGNTQFKVDGHWQDCRKQGNKIITL
jgi:hypothetical protein